MKITQLFEQIKNIMHNKGEDYALKYPEINEKNVFSISTLAHSVASQVFWKLNGFRSQNVNLYMTKGRAIHEFIQRRIQNAVTEYPLSYNTTKYKLIGHIDIVDFKNRELTDIKTTSIEKVQNCRLREYILQVGTYAKLIEMEVGKEFCASVIIINSELMEYVLTREDIENSFQVILQRAEEVYRELFEPK